MGKKSKSDKLHRLKTMFSVLNVFTTVLFIPGIYSQSQSILNFKFTEGRKMDRHVVLRNTVPSMYQCAQICLSFNKCKSFSFGRVDKKCLISNMEWTISNLHFNNDYVFAWKDDIPTKLGGQCGGYHGCQDEEICLRESEYDSSCVPYYQCLNGASPVTYCQYWSSRRGCDKNNIDTYVGSVWWRHGSWLYMAYHCKRDCRFCLEHF